MPVRTFETSVDAHILKTKLSSEGIESFVFDENIMTLNPLYSIMIGGVKVMVAQSDVARAEEIIGEIEAASSTDENGEVISCPACGSVDLYHGFKSMRGLTGLLSVILSFLLTVIPPYFKTVYKCKTCSAEFEERRD